MKRLIAALLLLTFTFPTLASVTLKSGASTDLATVGVTSKAMRVEQYDARGNNVSMKAGYSAASAAKFVAAAGTGVFAQIFGSSTKTVRIQRIVVCAISITTAADQDMVIFKRTAVGSGGTATTLTAQPKDSTSAAATATVIKTFTAAPTAGTGGGVIASQGLYTPAATGGLDCSSFDWTALGMNEAPVLRGTGEGLELNFGTAPATAPSLTFFVEFTEE